MLQKEVMPKFRFSLCQINNVRNELNSSLNIFAIIREDYWKTIIGQVRVYYFPSRKKGRRQKVAQIPESIGVNF